MPAFKLKLASTFLLALVEEKLSPLSSLYLSTQLSLKILAKHSKTDVYVPSLVIPASKGQFMSA